jgi:mono/diheme cytochrome c family protein
MRVATCWFATAFAWAVAGSACGTAAAVEPAMPVAAARPLDDRSYSHTPQRKARGAYLANGLLQCFICHSERDWTQPGAPPRPGMEGAGVVVRDDGNRRLVAPNLTPDEESGIGGFTDDMLARAIREGIGHDGRLLHPQMWYGSFRMLSDEDLASVVVYLRSRPAVRNPLPATVLSEDEHRRFAGRPRPLTAPVPAPPQSTAVERGRYLVEVADCVGCHTSWYSPRNPGMFAGGNPIERADSTTYSTNITPHPSGLAVDADGFVALIRTGKAGLTHPSMPWIAFAQLTDGDLKDMHAALSTLHPIAHFIGNVGEPAQCAVCGQAHPLGALNAAPVHPEVAVDAALLDRYAGVYRNADEDWTVHVVRDGDHLAIGDGGGHALRLHPLSQDRFLPESELPPLRFSPAADGSVPSFVAEMLTPLVFERVAESLPEDAGGAGATKATNSPEP